MLSILLLGSSIGYICIFILIGIISLFDRLEIHNRSRIFLFLLFAISLSVIAYYSTDGNLDATGWDLNRYYANIDTMRGLSFTDAYNVGLYRTAPITNVLFIFVSWLPKNYYLQAIGTFIAVSVLIYILNDIAKKYNYEYKYIFIMLMFILAIVGLSTILLGVRNINAIMFFVLAIYIESKNEGKITIKSSICYIVAIGFHVEAIFFVFVRILTIGNFSFIKYLLLFWSIYLPYILEFVSPYNEYIYYIYDKLLTYIAIPFYDWRVFFVQITVFIINMIIFYKTHKKVSNRTLQCQKYNMSKINMLYACMGSIMVYDLFARTLNVCLLIMMPDYIKSLKDDNQKFLTFIIVCLTLAMLAYQLVFMKTYWRFRI